MQGKRVPGFGDDVLRKIVVHRQRIQRGPERVLDRLGVGVTRKRVERRAGTIRQAETATHDLAQDLAAAQISHVTHIGVGGEQRWPRARKVV